MNMELQSAQNLEEICDYLELCVEEAKNKAWGDGISFALCFIKKLLPSAQPERKTGKWIRHPEWKADGECGYECDQCGMGSDVDYNFCMRCGAKMEV